MSTNSPQYLEEPNLSHAWGRAFLHVIDNSARRLAPLMVSVTGFENELPTEDENIRCGLDSVLEAKGKKFPSKVSALTIFPHNAWIRRGQPDVVTFSEWYLSQYLPRLQARDRCHNGRGTYFERMIRYQGSKMGDNNELQPKPINQLQHLATIWRRDRGNGSSSRHSSLQVSVFDPIKDHTGGVMLGFPCLQQVSFSYDSSNQLAVNAYYPTQYIMDRAYGNYLGLCHLGQFMAKEMGLKLVRLNCFIGLPELGNKWTKKELNPLTELVRNCLPVTDEN